MLSGNGRHRRPRQAPALVVAAGVTGSAIALPLLGATGAHAADGANWDRVAECETGGAWSQNGGNGYYGGLQLSQEDWEGYGGTQYAPSPDQASRAQQIRVAEKLLADRGVAAWPTCGPQAGLGGGGSPDEGADKGGKSRGGSGDEGGSQDSDASGSDRAEGADSDASADTGSSASSGASGTSGPSGGKDPAPSGRESGSPSPSATSDGTSADDQDETPDSGASSDSGAARDSASGTAGSADPGASGEAADRGANAAESGESDKSGSGGDASGSAGEEGAGGGRHRGGSADEGAVDDRADGSSGRHASRGGGAARDAVDGSYTVRPGDSLWGIADSLGVDGGWSSLYEENKGVVGADPDYILPGQELAVGGESEPGQG
ncbi:transglycosylase family protein [Streptomyces sp. NPDC052077]|uniref:LysM peptidoglycan-binding domain-containing protein n=1 Tax=Streptomyces sp. NPDC052077 TaxID=3154757 RepID=UPI00342A3113